MRPLKMLALACAFCTFATAAARADFPWSPPATVGGCAPATGDPFVTFPGSDPFTATGDGAIVWGSSTGTCISPVGLGGAPSTASGLYPGFVAPELLAGTTAGQIVAAGSTGGGRGALLETPATEPAPPPGRLGGDPQPSAVATAYRGDVAIASASGPDIFMRVQHGNEHHFGAPLLVAAAPGPVTELAVNLDYRTDAVVAWIAAGSVWARELPASGEWRPIQQLGHAEAGSRLQALVSDDGHAMVAWARDIPRDGRVEGAVYLDISGADVQFDARPTLVEAFTEPAGTPPPDGSLRLLRLSGESVRIAWTGMDSGRYVVRMAPVSLGGVRTPMTFSDSWRDAVLSDFAAGPRGDAVLVWSVMPQLPNAGFVTAAREIDAADLTGAHAVVAPAAGNGTPRAAFEQDADRAIVVWRTADGQVSYSLRDPVAAAGASFPAARSRALLLGLALLEAQQQGQR